MKALKLACILYVVGIAQTAPEENRFVRTTLAKNLDEPTELVALPNGKILITERKGAIKVYNPTNDRIKVAAKFDKIYTKFEYGLMGINIDPDFAANQYIYMYYTPDNDTFENHLARFVYDDTRDTILLDKELTMLKVGVKKTDCCHTGGSIEWDKVGNLYLSTGDDTNPFASDGYAPIDFKAGREGWDGLRAPGNTNDLRGKILRIKPLPDGSYAIPEGNLFAKGTEKTRPEIYVMGCRNPYRISIDKQRDFLYWGDIGPDAGKDNPNRGPQGWVEFNQARKAGNYGWPMFVGNNFAYNQYDFETKTSGEKFDALKPMNLSPNNTGLKELPPVNRPFIWYPYGASTEFPWVGVGGCNPMAGPVYYAADYKNGSGKFPAYFDGKFFAYEWMRDWIYLISVDKDGNYQSAERFMPNTKFAHPIDLTFDINGSLYVLDYGMNWFSQNEDATLSRIDYVAGNRKPLATFKTSTKVGASPLLVDFDAAESKDFDGDKISYDWDFGNGTKSKLQKPKVSFKKPGVYEVKLTVKDAKGNFSKQTSTIKVGNDEPKIDIIAAGNKTFYFENKPISYEVKVQDKEDGSLEKGISSEDVVVNINYLEGYDKTMLAQGHQANVGFSSGKRLIEASDCASCHQQEEKSIGPSYKDISKKYRRGNSAISQLADKVINGGGGVWGEQAMAPHPTISNAEAKDMVSYILSLNDPKRASRPTKDTYSLDAHKGKKTGAYLVSATYTDKGGKVIGPLSASKTIAFRSPTVAATSYDEGSNVGKFNIEPFGDVVLSSEHNGHFTLKNLDMTGIKSLEINAISIQGRSIGGTLEVRNGSQDGNILGSAEVVENFNGRLTLNLSGQINGFTDLFFVYKNPKADGKTLFGLSEIQFKD